MAAVGGRLFSLGGSTDEGASAAVHAYHPELDRWAPHPEMPTARADFGAASDGEALFVVGGEGGAASDFSTLDVYRPPELPELGDVSSASEEECPAGGVVVRRGLDVDADGSLADDEVVEREVICQDGPSLVETSDEPAGDNCPHGGTRVDLGQDQDADGVLDEEEIEETVYVCDGAPGQDGAPGEDGAGGADGEDAEPCTVTDNGDGTATITCPDGSEAVVGAPQSDKTGEDGSAESPSGCAAVDGSRAPLALLALLLVGGRLGRLLRRSGRAARRRRR